MMATVFMGHVDGMRPRAVSDNVETLAWKRLLPTNTRRYPFINSFGWIKPASVEYHYGSEHDN
jgi:hypothetical protein